MAEESMTKQYCPITQYILGTNALSFVTNIVRGEACVYGVRDFSVSPVPLGLIWYLNI